MSPALKFQTGPGRYTGGVSVLSLSCTSIAQQMHVNYDDIVAMYLKQPFKHTSK